jgi:hypothetical protein
MNYQKELQQLNKSLNPSKEQEMRMRNKVFGHTTQSNFLGFKTMFNSKQLYGALLGVTAVIFVLPIGFVFLGMSGSVSNEDIVDYTIPQQDDRSNDADQAPSPSTAGFAADDSLYDYESDIMALEESYENVQMQREYDEDTDTAQQNRAVIQDATLILETKNIRDDYNAIKDLASTYDGYIVESSYNGGELDKASVELRVPADKFQLVLDDIRGMNVKIISENVEAQDKQNELTELTGISESLDSQIADLEEKLANTQDQSEKDSIQREINSLKSQKSVNDSELSELTAETSFSTIEVELRESEDNGLFGNVFENTSGTLEFVVTFWINAFIIGIVPMIMLLVIGKVVAKRMGKRSVEKK